MSSLSHVSSATSEDPGKNRKGIYDWEIYEQSTTNKCHYQNGCRFWFGCNSWSEVRINPGSAAGPEPDPDGGTHELDLGMVGLCPFQNMLQGICIINVPYL